MKCYLSNVDGVLCVAVKSADWSEPRYVVSHYAIEGSALTLCRNCEVDPADLATAFDVREDFPGCWTITLNRSGFRAMRMQVSAIGGGRALPVATTFEPLTPPKSPGGKVTWESGRWEVVSKGGKRKYVAV